jgi:hypothetical protein
MSIDVWEAFDAAENKDVLRVRLTAHEVVLILDRLQAGEAADVLLAAKLAAEIKEQKIGRRPA